MVQVDWAFLDGKICQWLLILMPRCFCCKKCGMNTIAAPIPAQKALY